MTIPLLILGVGESLRLSSGGSISEAWLKGGPNGGSLLLGRLMSNEHTYHSMLARHFRRENYDLKVRITARHRRKLNLLAIRWNGRR